MFLCFIFISYKYGSQQYGNNCHEMFMLIIWKLFETSHMLLQCLFLCFIVSGVISSLCNLCCIVSFAKFYLLSISNIMSHVSVFVVFVIWYSCLIYSSCIFLANVYVYTLVLRTSLYLDSYDRQMYSYLQTYNIYIYTWILQGSQIWAP